MRTSHAVPLDRAGHAPRTAATAAEFAARDAQDLDALVGKHPVGDRIAVVADDAAWGHGEEVVRVVPLLTGCRASILVRRQDAQLVQLEGTGDRREQASRRST